MGIILASKSPRRSELLSQLVDDFKIEVSNYDESQNRPENPLMIPQLLSLGKALDVFARHQDDLIIGADTIVLLDDEVLEKPHHFTDAFAMLKKLNGRSHLVITGVTLIYGSEIICYREVAKVTFKQLDERYIVDYIRSGDPFDKAGGYAIQNPDFSLVESVEGEYETVVGLPLKRLKAELARLL